MSFWAWALVILICLALMAISFFVGYGIAKKKKIKEQVADEFYKLQKIIDAAKKV